MILISRIFNKLRICRFSSLQEYEAMELLTKNNIPTPNQYLVKDTKEMAKVFDNLKTFKKIIKAQVKTGGRGKGVFDSGLKGGVQKVKALIEANEIMKKMIGHNIVTKQTDQTKGSRCDSVNFYILIKVIIAESIDIEKELYFSIFLNRATKVNVYFMIKKIGILMSEEGGVDIEIVSEKTPQKIYNLDFLYSEKNIVADEIITKLGITKVINAREIFAKLIETFIRYDMTLLEINPLVISRSNNLVCVDAKIQIDDNALFRHPDLLKTEDLEMDEKIAKKFNINYIKLNGNIGCMVNGAGLAMATMDLLQFKGGKVANFMDVGGSASIEQIQAAAELLLKTNEVNMIIL